MRVKIVKCSRDRAWYNDKIGEIFCVSSEQSDRFTVWLGNDNWTYTILKLDCEITEENKMTCRLSKMEDGSCKQYSLNYGCGQSVSCQIQGSWTQCPCPALNLPVMSEQDRKIEEAWKEYDKSGGSKAYFIKACKEVGLK